MCSHRSADRPEVVVAAFVAWATIPKMTWEKTMMVVASPSSMDDVSGYKHWNGRKEERTVVDQL